MEEVNAFLSTNLVNYNGSDYGSGYGSGSGYGDGDGDGSGRDNGYDSGSGFGSGNGSGYGNGNGNGDGSGNGFGSGSGNGSGSVSGNGFGDGHGSGSDYGNGFGDGNGDNFTLIRLRGKTVYYIDSIPCHIIALHHNVAKVEVINTSDFTLSDAYVAKYKNCFAHGDTVKKAMSDAVNKHFSTRNIEERIREFKTKFKNGIKYCATDFYEWHGILTGSCELGRTQFMNQHNIKSTDEFTIDEFVEITEGAWGSEVIRRVK